MEYTLKNDAIELRVDTHGAETVSLKKDGQEYLWNADPDFWNRHAPVLFPFVGKPRDKKYRYQDTEYPMGQHGFARDCEFVLTKQKKDRLQFTLIDNVSKEKPYRLETEHGFLTPTNELFSGDALIFEDRQADSVSLTDKDGKPYLTVDFDTPLFGVWSPVGKNAPFICIEPWYGRADREDFDKDLTRRDYEMSLDPGKKFKGGFSVALD
ncbi:MAG: hypothetical protein PUG16_01780 [Lachnospiraceae bacterium]|nr:hypothetical protein [Lachnospiraceae bacterium]